MERRISHAILGIAFILVFIFSLSGIALAADYYHIVKKGDTLWGICEKYYGNPWLWPKLWEMNPFVTNPHLLKPGDKINLLEDVPLKHPAAKEEKQKQALAPTHPAESTKWWQRGLDVSGLTQVRSVGYFSSELVDPIGTIVSSDTERLILAEGDGVIVKIDTEPVPPGSILWVYKSSKKIYYPATREIAGFVISILGNIKITKALGKGLYKAIVNDTYRDIRVGDPLINYKPVSPCVSPINTREAISSHIIATKDLVQIVGQFTVVYLDKGQDEGVERGNLFEVVKERPGLPDLPIGYVLIVDTRPSSAVAVVVEAKEHFYKGIKLRSIQWTQAPRYLSSLPSCS